MKQKKLLRFAFLIVGFIFLANPNVNIIDLLPDAIGCLFIIAALFRLGDLSAEIGDAIRAFLTLFWITLSKLPATVLMFWITGNGLDQTAIRLVFAFCYATAEIVFGIRAFRRLFDGLAYLGERRDGGDFLYYRVVRPETTLKNGKVRRERVWRLESLTSLTACFLIFKSVLYTLPEVTTLASQNSLGYVTAEGLAWDRFYPLLVGMSVLLTFVFGMIWLVNACIYVGRIAQETAFWNALSAEYGETVVGKRSVFTVRRVRIFTVLASAGALFAVDFYVDGYNYLPDAISALLFLVAGFVIAKEIGGALWLKITSLLYFASSVTTAVYMMRFSSEYAYSAVHKIARAKELYMPYAVSNAVTQVLFFCTVLAFASTLMQIVYVHTHVETATATASSSRTLGRVYAGRVVLLRIFGALAAVMSSLYFYFVVDVRPISQDGTFGGGYMYFPRFEIAWIVDVVIALIFAVYACNLCSDLLEEVRYRYDYE